MVEPGFTVVEGDLGRQPANVGGDLGDGHEFTDIDHFGSGENQHGT